MPWEQRIILKWWKMAADISLPVKTGKRCMPFSRITSVIQGAQMTWTWRYLSNDEIRVTDTGQVSSSLGGETVHSISLKLAEERISPSRTLKSE
jgi:hypothetical protein